MIDKNFTPSQTDPLYQKGKIVLKAVSTCTLFLFVTAVPFYSYAAEPTYPISTNVQTTRQRTVRPVSIPLAIELTIDQVEQYAPNRYSSWLFGPPVNAGPLMPDGSPVGAYAPVETLLSFFSMSDIHIADKESPSQAIYGALKPPSGFGETNTSAYSPIMLSTTQVLDAAVQTINALHHKGTHFDFGISLGDVANNNQYNELRWFIDVMDGKKITPSSGEHKGAKHIDYQMPYQSSGLDPSIPWYQTIGNHDQYWYGTLFVTDYDRQVLTGNTVLNMGFDNSVTPPFPTLDARGFYMGVIDGATPYGTIIDAGDATTMAPPIIAPDRNRHALATTSSTSLSWMKEFFNTTSTPKGHGFTRANLNNDFASYTFEPKASLPLKVIVLDDTCKENPFAKYSSYARACLDQIRYDWLVNELNEGQADGKLMIIAAHIPVGPRLNVPDAPIQIPVSPAVALPNTTIIPLFFTLCPNCTEGDPIEKFTPTPPYNVVSDAMLLTTLHNYPNLLLWIAGHRHINTVTPQPSPDPSQPELGFWEVETSSLRDFPQEFRTFKIVRNDNNTVSIFVTDVDPAVQPGSPAAKSRGYGIGANRIAAGFSTIPSGLTDTTSHAYNAELIKPLPVPYTITVNVTGLGAVKSSPYSGINCTAYSSCSAAYLPGTEVTLVATPAAGAAFAGWTPPCTGTSTCTITMTSDISVAANFTHRPKH